MGRFGLISLKSNTTIWLLSSLLFLFLTIAFTGLSPEIKLHPDPYFRGDAALYFDIIKNGHTLFQDEHGDWAGNSGWAPLFAWIIQCIQLVWKVEPKFIAFILVHIFASLAIRRLILLIDDVAKKWLAVGLFLLAPGNIYFHALFPLTLLAWLLLEMIHCMKKSNWLLAGSFAYLAVLSYSIGFLLCISLFVWICIDWKQFTIQKLWLIALPILGLITWFSYDWACNGYWNALFKIQLKYGHSLNTPWKMMSIRWNLTTWKLNSSSAWTEMQNLFVLGVSLFSFYLLWKNRSTLKLWHVYLAIHIFLFAFVPYSSSPQSAFYRNALPIAPAFALVFSDVNRRISISVIVFFAIFSISTAYWFMADQLI